MIINLLKIHSVTLSIIVGEIPALSTHSTTAPVIEVLAVATAVEDSTAPGANTETSWNVNGPHRSVDSGELWSIVSTQLTGGLIIHLVTPLTRLLWLHVNEIRPPLQVVNTPPT